MPGRGVLIIGRSTREPVARSDMRFRAVAGTCKALGSWCETCGQDRPRIGHGSTTPPPATRPTLREVNKRVRGRGSDTGWIHDTGYVPAYEHGGYVPAVLSDGTETVTVSARFAAEVIGWHAACDCGWRGMQFYPRSQWPSPTGRTPERVDGRTTGTGAFSEWEQHLRRALPELAVHDLARQLAAAEERMRDAVHAARYAGQTWSRIAAAARTTVENVRLLGITDSPQPRLTGVVLSPKTDHSRRF